MDLEAGLEKDRAALLVVIASQGDGMKTVTRASGERFQREIRRRECMGTLWFMHNLLILLQRRGFLHPTT